MSLLLLSGANAPTISTSTLACNRKWAGEDGTAHEETIWLRISAFGKLAENCNLYLAKGRQVYVEGRLRSDENGGPRVYEKRDGGHVASYESGV